MIYMVLHIYVATELFDKQSHSGKSCLCLSLNFVFKQHRNLAVIFLIMMFCCGVAFPSLTSIVGTGALPAQDYHTTLLTKLSLKAPKCTIEGKS